MEWRGHMVDVCLTLFFNWNLGALIPIHIITKPYPNVLYLTPLTALSKKLFNLPLQVPGRAGIKLISLKPNKVPNVE